jgi:hypothetical protein
VFYILISSFSTNGNDGLLTLLDILFCCELANVTETPHNYDQNIVLDRFHCYRVSYKDLLQLQHAWFFGNCDEKSGV